MNKTPIFFMGNKEKLIKKGLIEKFPKSINTFYDVFGGSGIVSLNIVADKIVYNDIDKNIISLIQYFRDESPQNILNNVNENISKYKLPTFSTDTRKFKGDRDIYKLAYNTLRDDYNSTRNPLLLYTLNIFSNSHMLRYNSKGDFNMPFGNGYLTEQCVENILNNKYNRINNIYNFDFRNFKNIEFEDNDFIYLDPPYFNTTATYNENGGWTEKDEDDLYGLCEYLNSKGIKFAISNVFFNKGIKNEKLINWVSKNNFNVFHFDDFTYCSCGKGSSNTDEVLIMNY